MMGLREVVGSLVRIGCLAVLLAPASCIRSGVDWQKVHIAREHTKPQRVLVKLHESDVASAGGPTSAGTFLRALVEELHEREIATQVWTDKADPPPPSLLLFVDHYYDGDGAEGFACGWASSGIVSCGEGETVLGFRYHSAWERPTIEGHLRGWAKTGAIQDDGDESAIAAAEAIACVIDEGEACSDLPRKRRVRKRKK
jgi:hypothetical protein